MQKKPAAFGSGFFAKGFLERREVEKRINGVELRWLTASTAFLIVRIINIFERQINEL